MNFYELFEFKDTKGEHTKKKGSEDHQDVTIADPKAALALKQARNKYTYADSDLEAFIKLQQDEQEQDEKDIDKLERDTERQEQMIAKNKETVSKLRKQEQETQDLISKQEEQIGLLDSMTRDQEIELAKLRGAEKEYQAYISTIHAELQDLETRLGNVKALQGEFQAKTVAKPQLDTGNVPQSLRRAYKRT